MKTNLEDILGDALAPELLSSLQEAFDKKLDEMRADVEQTVREDMARRYEHDKGQLVEAMDRMLTDVVRVHESAKADEIAKLIETRAAYHTAIVENRKEVAVRLKEAASVSRSFINEHLTKEITTLRNQKAALVAESATLAKEVEATKAKIAEQHAAHLGKINEFVVRQVSKELNEFAQDKRKLVETRVKLVRENKQRLKEAQDRFFKESARTVEQFATKALSREMSQLHEDLEANRQNMFGRRIFEAVAAEFMTSYLAEGTEIRKLQKVVESKEAAIAAKDAELATAQTRIDEAARAAEAATRKVRLAEGAAARTKIMSELLANLKGEKRAVMESMLETYSTDSLRTAFNKILPVVLQEGRKVAPTGKKALIENEAKEVASVVTGDRNTRIAESVKSEANTDDVQIAEMVHLAGIKR